MVLESWEVSSACVSISIYRWTPCRSQSLNPLSKANDSESGVFPKSKFGYKKSQKEEPG